MELQQVHEGLTATQTVLASVIGTAALVGPFVTWLLMKRSESAAARRAQRKEDRTDALAEWQAIAKDLRQEQDADRKECDDRLTKLENRVTECEEDRAALRAEAAGNKVRIEYLESAVRRLENGKAIHDEA